MTCPKRRGKRAGARLHEITGAIIRLSETLRGRPRTMARTRPPWAAPILRAFLHRMAYLAADGKLSHYCRVKTCRDAGRVLAGHPRPGPDPARPARRRAARRLRHRSPATSPPSPSAASRAGTCPPEIMGMLCASLRRAGALPEIRVAVEIGDRHRPPARGICALPLDCLARDDDGSPVLVYDNSKAHRLRPPPAGQRGHRRGDHRPAGRASASGSRDTPPAGLRLLPSPAAQPRRDPADHRGQPQRTAPQLGELGGAAAAGRRSRVRQVPDLPVLPTGTPTPNGTPTPGSPIDVLAELMDHRASTRPRGYYRVGEARRREAVDKVTAMQLRPARQPDLARRPRPAGLRARPLRRRRRSPSPTAPAPSRPTCQPAAAPARSGSAAPAATTSAPTSPTSPT